MSEQTETLEILGLVRKPIQCEGIARGPERTAEIANSGAVGPQILWTRHRLGIAPLPIMDMI
jgi:hypothetical protein